MLSKSAISFGVFAISIFVGAVGFWMYGLLKSVDEAAMLACTYSVADAIMSSDNKDLRDRIEARDDWRKLESSEAARLLASVNPNKRFDCYQLFTRPDGGTKPPENIEIWVRRDPDKKLQISVRERR